MQILKNLAAYKINSNNQISIIVEILSRYNCRISEVLSAKWKYLFPGRFLILEGKKHSQNVIIRELDLLERITQLPKTHPELIFPNISYRTMHHHIKSHYGHLFKKIKTRKYSKVTHAFRYLNVEGIDNDAFIKDILNHNSQKSGKYYKNKIRSN